MIKNIEKINKIKRAKVEKIAKYIKKTDTENIIDKVIVFGSSVRDDCTVESDIDILLYVNKTANINTIYFNNIYGHIGIVADDLCDVLINTKISEKLLKHIEEYGVIIYEIIPTKI